MCSCSFSDQPEAAGTVGEKGQGTLGPLSMAEHTTRLARHAIVPSRLRRERHARWLRCFSPVLDLMR
jgi:hypothetical protein